VKAQNAVVRENFCQGDQMSYEKKVAQNVFVLTKYGLGCILGNFFSKLIWSPYPWRQMAETFGLLV
jgi:hypothetical protein